MNTRRMGTLLLLGLASMAWADRLTMKSGAVVDGTFLGGTSRQIRMEVAGQIKTYDLEQVRSVSFGEESAALKPPASPLPPRVAGVQPEPRAAFTIPADTPVAIRMIDSVNSDTARLGQTFQASLDEPIYVDGRQVVPRGAEVLTKLVSNQQAGRIQGRETLTLALSQISVNGRYLDVTSTDVRSTAESQTGRAAKMVGGTAALGAIVGAIAGGGKGAALGAGSGAAVGGAAQVLTNGPQVKIPSETRLTFRLQAPLSW